MSDLISSKLKYRLYEESVQAAEDDVPLFERIYSEVSGQRALALREDFCGTFRLCCEWVKSDDRRTAIGVDIASEPLSYGKKFNFAKLSPKEKKRLLIKQSDVRTVSAKSDLIVACNFSFYIFKKRTELISYFKNCLRGLKKNGLLILEMVGGPGFTESPFKEQRTVKSARGQKLCTYFWQHKKFDPISYEGLYAIHFKTPDGRTYRDIFTYDWRVWSIPEVRECLAAAGFSASCVYWENSEIDQNELSYIQTEKGSNDHTWLAYAVGIK
jgi:SAM-dependent methyltransferase